jgi:N-acetylmuramoyl-L-alanine amidase
MAHHVVKQGECLSSIARAYGFSDYRTLFDHAENAALKKVRPNPDMLAPGDSVFIPDKSERYESAASEARHRFVAKSSSVRLELAIRFDDQPVRSAAYVLRVGDEQMAGKTDEYGVISVPIDPDATRGHLRIDDPPLEWNLEIGHLDPVETNSGAQARLNNLDHPCGVADGEVGPRTRAAVRQFQARHGLKPTGAMDKATREMLKKRHDGA